MAEGLPSGLNEIRCCCRTFPERFRNPCH